MLDGIQLRGTLEAKTVATLGSSWNSKLQGFFCLQGETGEGRRILGVHPECELKYTGRVELLHSEGKQKGKQGAENADSREHEF